jgi:hypothetical protein
MKRLHILTWANSISREAKLVADLAFRAAGYNSRRQRVRLESFFSRSISSGAISRFAFCA